MKKIKMNNIKFLGSLTGHGYNFAGAIFDTSGISPTLTTMTGGGGRQPHVIVKACRMVGRNPDCPTCRKVGLPTEQRIEMNENPDVTNCLTTVQKDNLMMTEENEMGKKRYAVRKLTPTECGRLMGYTETDIKAMQSVNSNSQCYKQCGNAIVKQVLMAIFMQLHLKGVPVWNDLSEEERKKIIYKGHFLEGK